MPRIARAANHASLTARIFATLTGDFARFIAFEFISVVVVFGCVFGSGAFVSLRWGKLAPGSLFLIALFSTTAVFFTFCVRRLIADERWREFNRRLDGRCRADNDPYISTIDIRGASKFDRSNFIDGFSEIPSETQSVLLILRQTRKRWWDTTHPYTAESIKRQIEELEKTNKDGAKKIKWVCYVTRRGPFAAYQPFGKFRGQIETGVTAYADLLNETGIKAFRDLIKHHKQQEDLLKSGKAALSNTIVGLEIEMLPDKPLTNRQMLFHLREMNRSDVMLVSYTECKPIGIVSLARLLDGTATSKIWSDTARKDLAALLETWADVSGKALAKLEAPDNRPAPPKDYGDDSPEHDAMVPYGGQPQRWRPTIDLRFTPP